MQDEETARSSYVEQQEGAYRIRSTRVSLDSVVYAFWNGQTAESIAQSFPTLTLEQVYGAIAFYLAHTDEVDAHLRRRRADYDAAREAARRADPMLYRKLAAARDLARDAHA
jgi:uncharacterized protein (DUF433 family)